MVIQKTSASDPREEVVVEMEVWGAVDETGKARTRVNVKGSSVLRVTAELEKAVIGVARVLGDTPVDLEPEPVAETPKPVPKATPAPVAKPAAKPYKKPYGGKKGYKKGRTLNKELGTTEPTECPDCGGEMIEKIVNKKDGTQARVLECPNDGNTYWDNSYEG